MIVLCNMRDINAMRNQYNLDEVWLIVRSLKTPIAGCNHVPELSPSSNLFYKYLDIRNKGCWNISSFEQMYMPQFMHEMHAPAAQAKLTELINKDHSGYNIGLACFCSDEQTCHRSLIGDILQANGCVVIFQQPQVNAIMHMQAYDPHFGVG